MDYDKAKDNLTKLHCEFLTQDELFSRLRKLGLSEIYFHPYGCANCAQANGQHDFTDILYAIYPTKPGTDQLLYDYDGELGITLGDELAYTTIARCKFCGDCSIFHEVDDVP